MGRGWLGGFAAEGAAAVAVLDVNLEAAQRVAEDIAGAGASGMQVLAIRADVGQQGEVEAALAEVADAAGEVDIYCSNAGIVATSGLETTADDWQQNWQVNTMAHVYAAQVLIPKMAERGKRVFCYNCFGCGLAYRDEFAFLFCGEAWCGGSRGVAVAHSR